LIQSSRNKNLVGLNPDRDVHLQFDLSMGQVLRRWIEWQDRIGQDLFGPRRIADEAFEVFEPSKG